MLVSPTIDSQEPASRTSGLVVVDEIHAFAGDDRGWHLLAVLERISRLADREIQRIGLSATVGNPEDIARLARRLRAAGRRQVVPAPTRRQAVRPTSRWTTSAPSQNAAVVISRLHRGEKRLVFVDSRARAEQLGASLRQFDVTTFVTHSSLSQEQRRQAEQAFAERDELRDRRHERPRAGDRRGRPGSGHPDRLAPHRYRASCSGWAGPAGGRARAGTACSWRRATTASCGPRLSSSCGRRIRRADHPPAVPYHILAQQMMAITLQERGIGRDDLCKRPLVCLHSGIWAPNVVRQILQWMLDREILCSDQGIIGFGRRGEEAFGRKHFLELFSVFLSPPLFTILHGRQELGFVDELSFLGKKEGPRILLLGGRAWLVNHIDWQRRRAYVEATTATGRSRWIGWTRGLDYALCQSIKRLLTGEETSDHWSRRANEQIKEIRREFAWLDGDSTAVTVGRSGEVEWWTFGGTRANATLATALAKATQESRGLRRSEPDLRISDHHERYRICPRGSSLGRGQFHASRHR